MTSLEERTAIRDLVFEGLSSPAIAERLGIKVRTVRKWRHRIKKGAPCILRWEGQLYPLYLLLIQVLLDK